MKALAARVTWLIIAALCVALPVGAQGQEEVPPSAETEIIAEEIAPDEMPGASEPDPLRVETVGIVVILRPSERVDLAVKAVPSPAGEALPGYVSSTFSSTRISVGLALESTTCTAAQTAAVPASQPMCGEHSLPRLDGPISVMCWMLWRESSLGVLSTS